VLESTNTAHVGCKGGFDFLLKGARKRDRRIEIKKSIKSTRSSTPLYKNAGAAARPLLQLYLPLCMFDMY